LRKVIHLSIGKKCGKLNLKVQIKSILL
jgi:hypothetical protein